METKCENKTLIGSLEKLDLRAGQIQQLVELSDLLLAKFQRTADKPIEKKENNMTESSQTDLVGLFDRISVRLEHQINRIGANLENVLGRID